MSETLFIWFYRILVWPMAVLLFQILRFGNKKIHSGYELRRQDENGVWPWLKGQPASEPVWVHCASGEFEYAKPVIRELKKRQPNRKVMVTYFSPSFVGAIAKFPGVDFYCPLPWDSPRYLEDFLDYHRPCCLVIARTDSWPEMLMQVKRRAIPSLLFSATLSLGTAKTGLLGGFVTRCILSPLSDIFCVSDDDLAAFRQIGLGAKTKVRGDTRYDQAIERLKTGKQIRDDLFEGIQEPILIAGSTWPEDEKVLLEVIVKKMPIRFVLVPHEPTAEHVAHLQSSLASIGIESVLCSSSQVWKSGTVLIIDQIGILAELYAKGTLAFVGGSFRKSVHSVMEPLASGCLTFVGPHHLGNREALEFQKIRVGSQHTAVEVALDSEQMIRKISSYLEFRSSNDRDFIKSEIAKRSGKSNFVVDWIENRLK
jgi:3-deoxy-D-manno-octulosonic-acid transferase